MARPSAGIDDLVARYHTLTSVCVTGTNGKTSTTGFVDAMVGAAGWRRATVTTLGATVDGEPVASGVEFDAFASAVSALPSGGCLILETTSESLAEGFAWTWPPHVAALTQITRDHLDVHGTVEQYLAAKAQLFLALPPGGVAVLNANCDSAPLLREIIPPQVDTIFYGLSGAPKTVSDPLALEAAALDDGPEGVRITFAPGALADSIGALQLSVGGLFQGPNLLAAALAAHALGVPAEAISRGARRFSGPPGRFQRLCEAPVVLVDYAHNPDGLRQALRSARAHLGLGGALRCMFGCGGERDAGKRPLMGQVAHEEADLIYLTTDNPRGEDPRRIADEILSAVDDTRRWTYVPDRRAAIHRVIQEAAPSDVILLAGRGHEEVQHVGEGEIFLNEIEEAEAALGLRHQLEDQGNAEEVEGEDRS